ncbi:MAG: metal transporter [Desulfobacterales bacterium]|nr:metal transporter [Desulfobacterales bacterium]
MPEKLLAPAQAISRQVSATQNCYTGISKYLNEFMIPYLIASNYISGVEQSRMLSVPPMESFQSYMELMEFNIDICTRFFSGSMKAINNYNNKEIQSAITAWFNTVLNLEGENIDDFISRHSKMIDSVANVYPQAIKDIGPEFGFHFERGENIKVDETDRFTLYQVLPTDKTVEVVESAKPIIIIPPYVLGANILAFLPNEKKSYTHCYANLGIPTYIRILKDISITPALQTMSAEDDTLDTKRFCETVMKRHGKPVTLNGYCQGGFSAVCNVMSGELDGLVDALITCVSPMDGTRSKGLSGLLGNLPRRFNDLAYGTKTLPNGNKVADGKLMGWVYKLKSIENEAPIVAFFRDMMMLSPKNNKDVKISKTAAALNYWLDNERTDLPLSITKMSFDSYNIPVDKDGTLPIKLFDQKLNFKRINEKGIKWLICYGENDDLVEKDTALAPLDYIDVEISGFPKGHVAMATSWSNPVSACGLHTRFGEKKYRGPVRFQLDLDEELSEPEKTSSGSVKAKKETEKPERTSSKTVKAKEKEVVEAKKTSSKSLKTKKAKKEEEIVA